MGGNKIEKDLSTIRQSIDTIDAALIYMLAERFRCTEAVGFFKARHRLAPTDGVREAYQKERIRQLAEDASLDPDFAEGFLNFVIKHVISHHEKIAEKLYRDS